MRNKLVSAITAILIFMFCVPVYAADGVINTFTVSGSGKVEIIGYVDDCPVDVAMTGAPILMTDGMDFTNKNLMDHIMYINQEEIGNNGTFYYSFLLDERFSQSPYDLKINVGTLLTQTGTLPKFTRQISDNAIRIGNDVYDIGVNEYTPENITNSIKQGGNKIYFKIGGMWFNMLNSNATSNTYFTPENAVPDEQVDKWKIDNYYYKH